MDMQELKRHNLAMEKLTKERQAWNQKEIEEKKARELRQERTDANVDFNEINKSFKEYKKVMEIVHNGKKFTRFYSPSNEMKEYMTLAIGTMGLIGGWTSGKLISWTL